MQGQVIFLGPSARREDISAILPDARFEPPVARNELYRAREQGSNIFLIIDGLFSHRLAVSPREVIDVVRDGGLVFGASSMGALRGAECWPIGMRGLGAIARLYRMGWLESDDEVAVATNPDNEHAALSVALINVRYAMYKARRRSLLDHATAAAIVRVAQAMPFPERRWQQIFEKAGVDDRMGGLERFCERHDLKERDALLAARRLAGLLRDTGSDCGAVRHSGGVMWTPERYPSHDRYFGLEQSTLAAELTRWLFGSGRYQAYVWSMFSGERALAALVGTEADPEERAGARREALAEIMAERLGDLSTLAPALWSELEFLEELDAELMRWYSVRTLATETSSSPTATVSARIREEVAIAHGVSSWAALCAEVVEGRVFGAIPMDWIETACRWLARARA